jgi:hypothetical protein
MRPSLLIVLLISTLLAGCLSTSPQRRSDNPDSERPRSDLLPSSVGPRRE